MAYWDRHEVAARRCAEQIEKIKQKHRNKLNLGQQILFDIATADDVSYETEYDGRTYDRCRYCDAALSEGQDHLHDCDILQSRIALGNAWTNYTDELEAEQRASNERRDKRIQEENHDREKVACPECGKKVTRMGMKEHQKSTACSKRQQKNLLRFHEEQTGLVCYTDPCMNYEGKRCKQCNKPMPDAHSNAVFCSNKGRGNCKDKYHNRQPERIERSRRYTSDRQSGKIDAGQIVLARREHGDGWDSHKDC